MTEIFSNDTNLHSKPRDIIYDIVYAKPSDSIPSKWKCLLRQFDSCPKYIAPEFECSCTNVASRIKFNIYQLFSTYSVYRLLEEGKFIYKLCDTKIQCRNILIFKVLSNGSFIYDVYLSTLKNYIYYIYYVHIVSKNICHFLRTYTCYLKAGSISVIRDYAGKMSVNVNLEV